MAKSLDVHPKMHADQAFQAVARQCVERFRRHLPELRQNWDAEALHQARVGLRQLSAVFSLFRPMIADAAFPALRDRVKAAARILGEARDLDIVLAASRRPDLPALRGVVSSMRSRAYAGATQRLEDAGNRHLAEDLLDWIDHGAWLSRHKDARHRCIRAFAARRLDRMWRKFGMRAGHLETLAPRPRHKVRIAAKKLRYGFEFMAPLAKSAKARGRRNALIGMLREMQDALGTLNDVRMERQLAADLVQEGRAVAFAAGQLIGAQEVRTAPLLRRAAKAGRRLRGKKPFWR